jgi:hypothetical protein
VRALFAALVLSGCSVDCSGGKTSAAGSTTLTAGPFSWKCAAKLDGVAVAQGVPMTVKPGKHLVSCDAESLEVTVTRGESITVDYFGP